MHEFIATVGVAAIAATGWFGHMVNTFRPNHDNRATSTMATSSREMGKKGDRAASVDTACVAAAVATRESALGTGASTFGSAVSSAYSTRASALKSAYANTSQDSVRTSVKSAWEAFRTSGKSARDAWNATQKRAWETFTTSVKACGGSAAAVSDSANASVETSTQI